MHLADAFIQSEHSGYTFFLAVWNILQLNNFKELTNIVDYHRGKTMSVASFNL